MAGRRSKIKCLPTEQRAFVEQLLREDTRTLDELRAAIAERFPGAELPSRSSIHRYQGHFEEMVAQMREMETLSNAVVGELGEGIGEKAGALLAQAITTLATNAALKAQGNDEITIDEIRKLARAAKDAIDTRRVSLAERQQLEQAAQTRLVKEQKKTLDTLGKTGAISPQALATIREQIYGIRE